MTTMDDVSVVKVAADCWLLVHNRQIAPSATSKKLSIFSLHFWSIMILLCWCMCIDNVCGGWDFTELMKNGES